MTTMLEKASGDYIDTSYPPMEKKCKNCYWYCDVFNSCEYEPGEHFKTNAESDCQISYVDAFDEKD